MIYFLELFLVIGVSLIFLNFTSKPRKSKNKYQKKLIQFSKDNMKNSVKQIDIVFSKDNFPSKIFEKNFNYIPPFV